MTIAQLTNIGQALYGTQWQSNLAKSLNIDSRRVRQWLNDERPLPEWLDDELRKLLQQNIIDCQKCLDDLNNQ